MEVNELKTFLGEDLFEKVSEKVAGVDNLRLINTDDGKWIPKARFDAERQQSRELQAEVSALKTSLEEGEKDAGKAAEGFKNQIERLKKGMEEKDAKIQELSGAVEEKENRIGSLCEEVKAREGTIEGLKGEMEKRDETIGHMHLENAVRREIEKHHPRDTDIVFRLVDQQKVTRQEDGTYSGIQEQIEALKKDQGYLFGRTYSHKGGFPEGTAPENPLKAGSNLDVNQVIRTACGR